MDKNGLKTMKSWYVSERETAMDEAFIETLRLL